MQISNPKNMRRHHDNVIIVFFQSLCKTSPEQPTALKLCKLIVYYMFQNHVAKMTSY